MLSPDLTTRHAVRYNQMTGTIMESQITSSLQTLYRTLPNGNDVEVRFPRYAYTPMH